MIALCFAGVVVASAMVVVTALAATRSVSRRSLTEARILQIARRAAAGAGDRTPSLIQHSQGTRHQANLVAGGDLVAGAQWSYLIAERGSFVLKNASYPSGARAPRGSVLTMVVNAKTGAVTDGGVSDRYPDLAALGTVHTDLRQLPPGCLHRVPSRLPAQFWGPARRKLAPAGAIRVQLCGYAGANARPPLTVDRMRLLRNPAQITDLTGQFNALTPARKGVYHCPRDTGAQIIAELGYPTGRSVLVSVDLSGCQAVTNGTVVRTASRSGAAASTGAQLIRHLRQLLATGGVTPSEPVLNTNAARRGVSVPSTAGMTFGRAYTRLRRAGLRVSVAQAFSFASLADCLPTVTGSRPDAGTRVARGHPVVLKTQKALCVDGSPSVQKGLPSYTLPDLTGKPLQHATRWIDHRSLFWTVKVPPLSDGQAKTLLDNYVVAGQRPAAGSRLRAGILRHAGFRPTPLHLTLRQSSQP